MYQDSKRTCTAIVWLIKPFVWWYLRCRCRRGFVNSLLSTSAAYTHGQIVDAELANQSARFALVMLQKNFIYACSQNLSILM